MSPSNMYTKMYASSPPSVWVRTCSSAYAYVRTPAYINTIQFAHAMRRHPSIPSFSIHPSILPSILPSIHRSVQLWSSVPCMYGSRVLA